MGRREGKEWDQKNLAEMMRNILDNFRAVQYNNQRCPG